MSRVGSIEVLLKVILKIFNNEIIYQNKINYDKLTILNNVLKRYFEKISIRSTKRRSVFNFICWKCSLSLDSFDSWKCSRKTKAFSHRKRTTKGRSHSRLVNPSGSEGQTKIACLGYSGVKSFLKGWLHCGDVRLRQLSKLDYVIWVWVSAAGGSLVSDILFPNL